MNCYAVKKVYELFEIPMVVYEGEEKACQFPEEDKFSSIFDSEETRKRWFGQLSNTEKKLVVLAEDSVIFYGICFGKSEEVVIIGPLCRNVVDESLLMKYRHKHKLKGNAYIAQKSAAELTKILALLSYELTGTEIDSSSVTLANVIENVMNWDTDAEKAHYQLAQSEVQWDHKGVEYEKKILQIVRDGNIEAMERIVKGAELFEGEHKGKVAFDSKKQAEYFAVTMIALITRAAVDGGMNPERAYGLGDIYLQRLEQCREELEMLSLAVRAQYEFTEGVKVAKESSSKIAYIEKCKDYIAKHLRKPFKVGDIAPEIGINRSYLARRFAEVEGITIQQYIMKERCIHAANLLKNSNYSIALIAEYFCFSSQSHFGRQFKTYMGMTPKEYRNQYQNVVNYE